MNIEVLARDGQHTCGIVAAPDQSDAALVDLAKELTEDERADFQARGWYFAGLVGVVNGNPELALEHALPPALIFAVGIAHQRLIQQRQGDSVDWLARLHQMPDFRVN
jgi:hypothetical protein